MIEWLPQIFMAVSGIGLVGVYSTPKITEYVLNKQTEGINKDVEKLGYNKLTRIEQLSSVVKDLNSLLLLPDGVVRPKYSFMYYTLLYEIQNKVKLNNDEFINPIDSKVINKNNLKVLDDTDNKYIQSRKMAVTRELTKDEVSDWIKRLSEAEVIRDETLKQHFLKTYMEKTSDNRIKYMKNTDKVIIGENNMNDLIEEQERKFRDSDIKAQELLYKKVI